MKQLLRTVLVIFALAAAMISGVASALFNDLLDLRYSSINRAASGEIAIVAIDAPSLAAEGVWPWPRTLHAKLIDRLVEVGAREIVFDVDFSSASTPSSDQSFEDALRRAGGSIAIPTFMQFSNSRGHNGDIVSRPLPRFAAHSWSAAVNVRTDPDGIVRRYAIGQMLPGGIAPSLAVFIAGRSSVNEASFLIDFGIRPLTIPTFSFSDVLLSAETLAQLHGKKVIVGATAVELGDRVTVPGGRVLPGVVLQALAAESLAQGRDFTPPQITVSLGLAIALILLMAVLYGRISIHRTIGVLIGVPIACEGLAYTLQMSKPYIVDTVPLHVSALAWGIVIVATEFNLRDLLRRISDRRFLQVSMSLADGLICTNDAGKITFWNPAAELMFGHKSYEIIGRHASSVIQTDQPSIWVFPPPATSCSDTPQRSQEMVGKRRDGSEFLIEVTLSAWDTDAGKNHSIAVRDISIRKREEDRIRYLAEHDPLTGLLNRRSFIQNLEARIVGALGECSEVALLLIDVDHFKEINDTLGHAAGDKILCEAAAIIQQSCGLDFSVARLGGDEFAVALSAKNALESAKQVSISIVNAFASLELALQNPFKKVGASIGVSIYPRNSDSAEAMMADADLAMYQAKSDGGDGVCFFNQSIRDQFEEKLLLADELNLALTQKQFELHYQPQIDLNTGSVVGAEALIRWRHPKRGLVPPAHFITLLNTLPISNEVSVWVLRTACQQAREWQQKGWNIRVGVNLSPAQFKTMDLPSLTAQILAETGLPARLLELEVTEEIVIEDDVAAIETFKRLHALGVNLAWDDFGTGYGSLIYLKKFALDRLKIDQSFIRDLKKGTQDWAIVEYTIRLCKVLGLSVIAEGIEARESIAFLRSLGCDEGQGYYFSRPLPPIEFYERVLSRDAHNAA